MMRYVPLGTGPGLSCANRLFRAAYRKLLRAVSSKFSFADRPPPFCPSGCSAFVARPSSPCRHNPNPTQDAHAAA